MPGPSWSRQGTLFRRHAYYRSMDAERSTKATRSTLNLYPASIGTATAPTCMPAANRASKIAANLESVFNLFFIIFHFNTLKPRQKPCFCGIAVQHGPRGRAFGRPTRRPPSGKYRLLWPIFVPCVPVFAADLAAHKNASRLWARQAIPRARPFPGRASERAAKGLNIKLYDESDNNRERPTTSKRSAARRKNSCYPDRNRLWIGWKCV